MYYESVRKRNKEIESKSILNNISNYKLTKNLQLEDIEKIYNHIFINKYNLLSGYDRFDPSYDMAQSWQRLREGKNILEHDLIMLLHERMEYDFMNLYGMKYDEAHALTCEKYDYLKALKIWKKEKE